MMMMPPLNINDVYIAFVDFPRKLVVSVFFQVPSYFDTLGERCTFANVLSMISFKFFSVPTPLK